MDIALSPCPNDTFLFHGWITGAVGKEIPCRAHFADIEQLNEWALAGAFPLIKVSIACLKEIQDSYELLPVGCALGYHSGPKLIAKKPFSIHELKSKGVAIPGRLTTAHLLFDVWAGSHEKKLFCLYHEIFNLLRDEVVDAGLVIHESRFTYQKEGFYEIADLGDFWHSKTHLPLPLGGIVIKREIPEKRKRALIAILQDSLKFGRENPKKSEALILEKAQEKDPATILKHIETYVNNETENLSRKGLLAIETLLNQRGWFCRKNS